MASRNLWTIVDALRERGEITPREVMTLLGCDCKKAHHLVFHLMRAGVVVNVGRPYRPIYKLRNEEVNLKPVKPAVVRPRRQPANIIEQCRGAWQGYQVHKIFGSAKA